MSVFGLLGPEALIAPPRRPRSTRRGDLAGSVSGWWVDCRPAGRRAALWARSGGLEIAARAMCTDPRLPLPRRGRRRPSTPASRRSSTTLLGVDPRASTAWGVLLIEHDMSVVMKISDHVVVLDYGRKNCRRSPAKRSRNDPRSYPRLPPVPKTIPMLEVRGKLPAFLRRHPGAATASTSTSPQGEIVTLISGPTAAGQNRRS